MGIQPHLEPTAVRVVLADVAAVVGARVGEEREDWKEGATAPTTDSHGIYAQETKATVHQWHGDFHVLAAYLLDCVAAPLDVFGVSGSLVLMLHQQGQMLVQISVLQSPRCQTIWDSASESV